MDKTFFVKENKRGMIIDKIYVDEIIFGGTLDYPVDEFVRTVTLDSCEFSYFLDFQVNKTDDEIFLSENKYAKKLVERFGISSSKYAKISMSTNLKLLKDEDGVNTTRKVLINSTLR